MAAAGRRCLRIGTQEVTRRGMEPADMDAIAELVGRVLVRGDDPVAVRAEARALRRARADRWRFCREP